ncbi:H-NS family nucleoid-associated regulatory protein [Comamonas jiangduensis]|uniref:H-NS histone family protein n=1 Tax=Comamonas jiangduensis TaxID=1194168 RepID=UPI003BF888A1
MQNSSANLQKYKELLAQASELEKQAKDLLSQERSAQIAQIRQTMADFNITIEDLQGASKSRKKAEGGDRAKVPAKYRNAQGETWTGRGRQPRWVADHVAAGGKVEDLAITE